MTSLTTASSTSRSGDGGVRLLRLTGAAPEPWCVDLHPRLAVVGGLPPEVRAAVGEVLADLLGGRLDAPALEARGLGGIAVVDGAEVPLSLALARALPVVPTPSVPPPAPVDVDGSGRARALDAEMEAATSALRAAEDALRALRRRWDDEREDRAGRTRRGWRERATAAAVLRHARARSAEAAAAVAATGPPSVDPAVDPEVTELIADRLAAARAARHAGSRRDRPDVAAPPTLEVDRWTLVARHAYLVAELDALDPPDTTEVAAALAACEAAPEVPVEEAERLAAEWERVRGLVGPAPSAPPSAADAPGWWASRTGGAVEASRNPGAAELAGARVRAAQVAVAAARRALLEANAAAPLISPEATALEAAHAEVLAAWEASGRRLGSGRARRRLEEAQRAEQEILDRLGYGSYTELMVSGRGATTHTGAEVAEAERRLRSAEQDLATAEEAQEALSAAAGADEPGPWDAGAARGRLATALVDIETRARALLGADPGDDVAAALRARAAADPLPRLRSALEGAGVEVPGSFDRGAVLARARAWLERVEGAAARRDAVSRAREEVAGQLEVLDAAERAHAAWSALARGRAAVDGEEGADDLVVDLTDDAADPLGAPAARALVIDGLEADARDAQAALDAAVEALVGGPAADAADGEVDLAERLGRVEGRVALAHVELEVLRTLREAAPLTGPGGPPTAERDAGVRAWELLARVAAHHEASRDEGPVPVLLDDPVAGLADAEATALAAELVGPASAVQVLLLTDHPAVLAWADALPADAGARVADLDPSGVDPA